MTPLVKIRGVSRTFPPSTTALSAVDLDISAGESVAIIGASGSGKSTLLGILGLLDRASSGTYELVGRSVAELSDADATQLRAQYIGFVFQSFLLIPHLTVLENVELALTIEGTDGSTRAREMLEVVGLSHRLHAFPSVLSGGEQQRAAIARAAVRRSRLMLCDEPTGNLDERSSAAVLSTLLQFRGADSALVVVTHDMKVASACDRVVRIRDGRIEAA
jgi:putative ABC transport system ATP-binding protein